MRCFKLSFLIFILTISGLKYVFAQEFNTSVSNPFAINIDTSGGLDIFGCDFVDFDNDGDIDLMFPFIDEKFNFAYQENIGSSSNPIFKKIEVLNLDFPEVSGFLIPDFADMNNDGLLDFISFGTINDSTGFNCSYFENTGNNVFELNTGASIGLPGIGYALGIPEIVDLNQDGDKDIILSGALIETFTDEQDAMFYYGQNSNASDPNFAAWFIEPYSFAFMDTFQVVIIKTGDLDLDGDLDLLMNVAISEEETRFMYQENISPPFETNDFSGPQSVSPFGLEENIDGLHFLEDLDGDGDLDLFLYDDLNMIYYENTACINTNSSLSVSLCGETSYSLNDVSYSSSGSYMQVIENNAGCDSTIVLDLEFNEQITSDFEVSICEGSSYDWNNEIYTIAGTYEQTFTTQSGCDSIVTLNLSEFTIDYTISLEENTLTVEAVNAEIAWFDCESNSQIEGENQSTYTPNETGSYAAIVSQDGCEMMSECFDIMITSTKNVALSHVYIFPNPAESLITLHGLDKLRAEKTAIIFNVEGKKVVKQISDGQIDVSDLRPGYYHLSISYDRQIIRIPLIIIR